MKFAILVCSLFFSAMTHAKELETVPYVDLGRYAGVWYQIAHKPLFFEGGTCPCARQVLTPRQDGVIGVYNSCNSEKPGGEIREIRGVAINDNPKTNARFTVDFNLPFKGSYWIIGLDHEYRFAVVSDKYKYSLYILAKEPTLSAELYGKALELASRQLDLGGLEVTLQKGCSYPSTK